jgi:UDP-N-acetylglucosamine 1-carboxyvinyltransferase
MDRIRIRGGRRLCGEVPISGAKNAALPLMAAALLTDAPLELRNLPRLDDIAGLVRLLERLGVEVETLNGDSNGHGLGQRVRLTARDIADTTAPYDLVRKMRASVLVLGPLLARCRQARVSLPGGCAIGTRPVDLHIDGLVQLGAEIDLEGGYINAAAPQGLVGARVEFPIVSVGATENLMMAACLAQGTTVLANAAREPEIVDLAQCLTAMGARIEGSGSGEVTIHGVDRLHGASHSVIPDRIEFGTYAMAAAITGGDIELLGAASDHATALRDTLGEAGVQVSDTARGVRVHCGNARPVGVDVSTAPYPGFPTDLQAQVMALMALADGFSIVTETIFENRFMHVPELCRMGADITVHGASAMVRGVPALTGAPVMASDLRASAGLILAGLAAEGVTEVNRVYHLDRGYERMDRKLAACGADIERVPGNG